MAFLKLGQRFINMDLVIEVVTTNDSKFFLVTVARSDGKDGISLEGEENEAFRRWLEKHTSDPAKPNRKKSFEEYRDEAH
jgi:hypothetical protein